MPTRYARFDPLLPPAEADAVLRLCERFGSYGMYGEAILARLLADLRARGRLGDAAPGGTEPALLLIDEYVRFPPAGR